MKLALFGDLHGRVLLPFYLMDRWQQEHGEAIEYAIRFRIKKLPAIVFNDKSVVYGVTSLQEAIRIFNNKGGDR